MGWLGLVALALLGALDDLSPLLYVTGMLVAVGGLATLGVWLARGGDLRDALHRLGSPGFGRTDPPAPAAWVDPAPRDADPTLVLDVDGEPTVTMPVPDPTSGDPTLVLGSVDRARAAATAAADARAAAAEAQRRARAEAAPSPSGRAAGTQPVGLAGRRGHPDHRRDPGPDRPGRGHHPRLGAGSR